MTIRRPYLSTKRLKSSSCVSSDDTHPPRKKVILLESTHMVQYVIPTNVVEWRFIRRRVGRGRDIIVSKIITESRDRKSVYQERHLDSTSSLRPNRVFFFLFLGHLKKPSNRCEASSFVTIVVVAAVSLVVKLGGRNREFLFSLPTWLTVYVWLVVARSVAVTICVPSVLRDLRALSSCLYI